MTFRFRIAAASLIALASLLLIADLSLAQQRRSGGGQEDVWKFLADKYDKNDDGKLTEQEYNRGADTFARLDRNKDGVLTAKDWTIRGSTGRNQSNRRGTGRGSRTPEVGDQAPDFELAYVSEPSKSASLSSFAGKKPVALIFGSCT